jgi:DNA polymerase-1
MFRELEFRTLARQLMERLGDDSRTAELNELPPTEAILINSKAQLDELVVKLNGAEMISFDVETTGLDKMTAGIVGICLAVEPPVGYYIPTGHLEQPEQSTTGQMSLFAGEATLAADQLSLESVLEAIRPALTNPNIPKVAHNAKYDYTILDRHGLRTAPITFDTMIAEFLTNPASKHKGLKDLARHRLGMEMTPISKLIGKGRSQKSFAEVLVEEATPYGAADADMTLRLVPPLQAEIKEKGLEKILELEMPLIGVLSDMEQAGVALDVQFFQQMSRDLQQQLIKLEVEIHDIAGGPFNINSTQQLSDVLFKKLDLPHEGLKRNKSGHYSTAANVLEGLKASDTTGIINAISKYRELRKLKSTYVDALPQMVNPQTHRIHTSFNQTGAVTGRIASSSPNLQNIPIRSKVGQQIRRGFQVELRILAHISQDETLLRAFHQDQDIHRSTAAAVYDVDIEEVTYDQRRFAKAVNFGLIYGMGAFRLARDSDLTLRVY